MDEEFDLRKLVDASLITRMEEARRRAKMSRAEWLQGVIALGAHIGGQDRSEEERDLMDQVWCPVGAHDEDQGEENPG